MPTLASAEKVPPVEDRTVVSAEDGTAPPPAPLVEVQALDSSTYIAYTYIYVSHTIDKARVTHTHV